MSAAVVTAEQAAAFKKVEDKKRIIWKNYAAAFQAALECVNTKESQDFAIKFVPKGLPYFTGEGQGLPPAQPGSAWDDWCGEYRRQGNHPAEDQTQYFQTALRCAVKLVLHSLDRGCVELIAALDTVLDKGSAIYSFRREPNTAAHDLAMALHAECTALWREEGGPQKRSVELLCWTRATLQPVCYSASHLQLETVQGEVIQNSDILADTTYVLRLRLKDEWGCDVDCIPLKQAAQQHLTLDCDGPKLDILHSNDSSRLLPQRSKSDECESNEFKAPFYLNAPSGDLLVRFMALESGKLRLTVNVGGVRERAVGKPCCVRVRHRMPSSIRLVCKEEQQLGTIRPEIHHGDNWEVTVEIVDSGGFPVQCKESSVSVDLQQSVQGQTRNGTNRYGQRCASLELSISACSGLEVLPLGKRGTGGVAKAGRGTDYGEVCAGRSRVPRMGDVVECEMVELSAPGGVEWLAGEVIHVDSRKKVMKVRIQENETTSNEEKYKFSEEGKEWRWPSQAKQATSDTPASWSAKRKGKANELKSDPDDDDLFVPRTSTTPSSCRRRSENGGNSDQGGGEDPTLMASRYRISLARPLSPDHFGTFLVQITVRLEDGQDVRLDCIDLGFEALPNRNPEEWSASDVVYYLRSKSLAITADFLTDAHKNPITGRVLLGNNIGNDEVEVLVERTLLLREALEIKKEDTESKERIKLISADLTRMMNEASFLKGPHKFLYERCIKESDLVLSDQVLGEGATAEVRRGVWRNGFIDENVAIKISRMSVDIEGAKGFEKEVRRIKDCRHAHVVECYGMTVTSPSRGALRIGIVMELCQSSLQEYFQGGVPKWRERLRVCLEAARGIAHLHKLAYHHRDIKPANILIAQGGTIKVADFGIARRLDLTHMTNAAKGTERYMSPEALTNQQDELPSDVYSFGCVLFYLMTGHEPWHTYTVSSMRTALLHDKLCIADVDSDKTSAMEDCPPNFVDLIRECTAFSASARPAISNIISRLQVAMDHTPWESGQLPSFWSKRGLGPEGENRLIEILPHEEEYNLICNRLHDVMPDAAVSKIELNYNPELWAKYYLHLKTLARKNRWGPLEESAFKEAANERFLWHGLKDRAAIPKLLESGYKPQYVNLDFNFYGAGTYFAPDARVANSFDSSGKGLRRTLILNRVTCGKIGVKTSLASAQVNSLRRQMTFARQSQQEDYKEMQRLLRKLEHREAPSGFQSVTGHDPPPGTREPETELIIYDNYQAFPAFVVTFDVPEEYPNHLLMPRPYLKTVSQVKADL